MLIFTLPERNATKHAGCPRARRGVRPQLAVSIGAVLTAVTSAAPLGGTAKAQEHDVYALRSAAQARADRRLGILPDLRSRLDAGEGFEQDLGAYLQADPNERSAGAKLSARSLLYWRESRFLKKIEEARELRRKRLGEAADTEKPPPLKPSGLKGGDVWALGRSWEGFGSDATTSDSSVSFGAERSFEDEVVIGLMTQLDRRLYRSDSERVRREGWLAGPYLLARPSPNLTIDALAGFGQAERDSMSADPVLSEGYLLRGRVEGALDLGAEVTARPEAMVLFQHELGAPLEDPDAVAAGLSRGAVSFGPRLERPFEMEDLAWAGDVSATPFAKLGGSWGFGPDRAADPFTARSEAGFEASLENGWSILGSSYLDGLGGEADKTYGGKIDFKLALP